VDWFTYYELAKEWAEADWPDEVREAYRRSAVSRAYYAMYCTARDKLDDANRYHPSKCDSKHLYVWKKYKEDREYPEREQIGRVGDRLRRKRIQADYYGFIDHFPDVVERAMEEAEELRVYLEDLTL
jgi:uncharacterized protein (UPF0332 family)